MDISVEPKWVKLKPIEATAESFSEYGQVVEASPDGDEFGPRDAQLDLSNGVPRFYIMHLQDRPLRFSKITHHASVTQCLGSIGGHVWYLGVAKPTIVDAQTLETTDDEGKNVVQSKCSSGHFYVPPAAADVHVFKITGPKFLKLNHGTWHAGPLFRADTMDFYNLELSNTNVVDHTSHDFAKEDGVKFLIDEQLGDTIGDPSDGFILFNGTNTRICISLGERRVNLTAMTKTSGQLFLQTTQVHKYSLSTGTMDALMDLPRAKNLKFQHILFASHHLHNKDGYSSSECC